MAADFNVKSCLMLSDKMDDINSDIVLKPDRLKKRSDFLRVQHRGMKWVTKFFVIQKASKESSPSRFGLIVSKKFSKKAVDRNYGKRRLRAICGKVLTDQSESADYVLIARHGLNEADFTTLEKDLKWALRKLKEQGKETS